MADGRYLEKDELLYLSNFLTDFDEILYGDAHWHNLAGYPKFEILKIRNFGLAPFLKPPNAISPQPLPIWHLQVKNVVNLPLST